MPSVNAKKRIRDLLSGTKATTGYYGLGDLLTNTDDIISEVLAAPTYSDTERANAIAWYAGLEAIPVRGEYPRKEARFPAVYVYRVSDGEVPNGPLGDAYGVAPEGTGTDEQEALCWGTRVSEQIQIQIHVDGEPGLRDDLYLFVREFVLRGRVYLHDGGVQTAVWVSGQDGDSYQPGKSPHIVHTALATVRCELDITWTDTRDKILDVGLTHRDYGGAVDTDDPFTVEEYSY